MDAKEARKRALEITGEKEKEQLELIESYIEDAVNEGKMNCSIPEFIMPAVKSKLLGRGYEVQRPETHRNETTVVISW